MKTAIYIEDGVVQLVITPESKFEKNALSTLGDNKLKAEMFEGQFYDCRGGWVRQKEVYAGMLHEQNKEKSLIIKVDCYEEEK